MKRFYLKFRIGLMTFAFGLASVFVFQNSLYSDEIYVDLPKVNSDSVIEISASNDMLFSFSGGGCGLINGYGGRGGSESFHSSFYGHNIYRESSYHDNKKAAKRELEQRIKAANKVLEYEEFTKNNVKKTRVVLETKGKDRRFDIIIYDGEKLFFIISSRSFDAALEFEKLTKSEY